MQWDDTSVMTATPSLCTSADATFSGNVTCRSKRCAILTCDRSVDHVTGNRELRFSHA